MRLVKTKKSNYSSKTQPISKDFRHFSALKCRFFIYVYTQANIKVTLLR